MRMSTIEELWVQDRPELRFMSISVIGLLESRVSLLTFYSIFFSGSCTEEGSC